MFGTVENPVRMMMMEHDSAGEALTLHPAPPRDNWLYFLTVNPKTGLTKFTNSYAQFQAYEVELNANLAKSH